MPYNNPYDKNDLGIILHSTASFWVQILLHSFFIFPTNVLWLICWSLKTTFGAMSFWPLIMITINESNYISTTQFRDDDMYINYFIKQCVICTFQFHHDTVKRVKKIRIYIYPRKSDFVWCHNTNKLWLMFSWPNDLWLYVFTWPCAMCHVSCLPVFTVGTLTVHLNGGTLNGPFFFLGHEILVHKQGPKVGRLQGTRPTRQFSFHKAKINMHIAIQWMACSC